MHTVELLEQAVESAKRLGYQVRYEWLGGSGGGACRFGGRNYIFVDLALTRHEQLEQVAEAIRRDPGLHLIDHPAALQRLLGIRKAG